MKVTNTILLLIFSQTLFSQSDKLVGEYYLELEGKNHQIEYRLSLNQGGTYIFQSYTKTNYGITPVVHKYTKGKWSADDKVISFCSYKEKDLDEKYTLDLTNSKARFITKSVRDKTDRIIKTRLKFLESETFWIKGLEIFKV